MFIKKINSPLMPAQPALKDVSNATQAQFASNVIPLVTFSTPHPPYVTSSNALTNNSTTGMVVYHVTPHANLAKVPQILIV